VRRLKALVPDRMRGWLRELYYPCFRAALFVRYRYADAFADAFKVHAAGAADGMPMPPALLRYRVSEDVDPDRFRAVGKRTSESIQAALLRVGRRIGDFHAILDFGCGCGRTLTWLTRQFPDVKFHGTDVDTEAIAWCRAHLPLVDWQVNAALPPLERGQGAFDLVYAISVFTHLDADHQDQWLHEFARVLRPGGILLLTVHGEGARRDWDTDRRARLEQEGFVFETSTKLRGIVPEWYHTAHHTREYAVSRVGAYFRVLAYIEGGMGDQDAIVARRDAVVGQADRSSGCV